MKCQHWTRIANNLVEEFVLPGENAPVKMEEMNLHEKISSRKYKISISIAIVVLLSGSPDIGNKKK